MPDARLLEGRGDGPDLALRTGDLGYVYNDQVYVTGRLKDLIIIRGRKLYPQDIEYPVGRCHPQLRPGISAAFSIVSDAGVHGTPRDGMRAGALAWLVAHGSGLTVAGAQVGVLPLGLTALCAWTALRSFEAIELSVSVIATKPSPSSERPTITIRLTRSPGHRSRVRCRAAARNSIASCTSLRSNPRRWGEYAFIRPGREMLFSKVDRESKYKAKNVCDVAVYRIADATHCKPCSLEVLSRDPLLATVGFLPFGVNGLALDEGERHLYINNAGDGRLLRMPLVQASAPADPTAIPINMFDNERELIVVAPMPRR